MKLIIKIIIYLLILPPINQAFSQESKIRVWAGVGIPAIQYINFNGSKSDKLGVIAGLGYHHIFNNENLAFNIGVEYGLYKSKATFDELRLSRMEIDSEDMEFELRTTYKEYNESHSISMINIPLSIEYNRPLSEKMFFYMAGGLKIGFSAGSKYESSISSLETRGYYKQWDLELYDLPRYGLMTLENLSLRQNKIKVKTNVSLNFDVGLKFDVGNGYDLYLGGFIDYGITKPIKFEQYTPVLEYKEIRNAEYNTDISAVNMFETGAIESARLIITGIKLSFTIPLKREKSHLSKKRIYRSKNRDSLL